jgi:metal-responsive CopG/Arc/MetJ family transcriptional regulator
MAKVMISFPDELLERFDAFAHQHNMTRSGLLQELAEREMAMNAAARGERIRALLATARPHGGDNARLVRELRDSR